MSETGDAIGFRQQLSTTSCEAFELEITVNYPVHTLTENGSFMRNLETRGLIRAFLAGTPDCAQDPPLLRDERGLPLPGCWTIVPALRSFFSRLPMFPSFQAWYIQRPSCTIPL